MRVITWNCNMAFRKKSKRIVELNPDIIVIPECENPHITQKLDWLSDYEDWRWFGENNHQGVGVFVRNNTEINELPWFDPDIRYIRPYSIICHGFKFNIIAVWANNAKSPTFRYIGQVWKFLQAFDTKLHVLPTMVLGDFNSNTCWDISDRWWNHSDVVRILKKNGMESLYHRFYGAKQGAEVDPTLYFQKNKNKPYHIDYLFASYPFIDSLQYVSVGSKDEWLNASDHMPLVFDFDEERMMSLIMQKSELRRP